MQTFTCPNCGRGWSENYCPECARTIDRSLNAEPVKQPQAKESARVTSVHSSGSVATRYSFRRAFIITLVLQLAFYLLYWMLGKDKATSSFNAFGNRLCPILLSGSCVHVVVVGATAFGGRRPISGVRIALRHSAWDRGLFTRPCSHRCALAER